VLIIVYKNWKIAVESLWVIHLLLITIMNLFFWYIFA